MKEQGAKSFFQSKLRTLTALHKETEAKLWDSFREGEARERALRKQLSRVLKAKATVDIQNELLQSQLQTEQDKSHQHNEPSHHQAKTKKGNMETVKGKKQLSELENRLKRYEEINIENLIQELVNKTALAEELLQEKRDKEKMLTRASALSNGSSAFRTFKTEGNPRNSLQNRENGSILSNGSFLVRADSFKAATDRAVSANTTIRNTNSPAPFGLNATAIAAEPVAYVPQRNVAGQEKIDALEAENKALRRKLFLNGIALPSESKRAMGRPSQQSNNISQYTISRGTTPNLSRPRTANAESETTSRPITAQSASQVGILKNPLNLDPSSDGSKLPYIPSKSFKGVFFDL